MEDTRTMKVNPLPSRTWHWLKMNESTLDAALPVQGLAVDAKGALRPGPGADISIPAMETGMGPEFDAAMSGTDTMVLEAPAGYEAPVTVLSLGCAEGQGAGRLYLHAGKGSALPVVLLLSEDAGPVEKLALQVKVYAEEGARVQLSLSQLLGGKGLCLTDIDALCERDAHLSLTQLALGAAEQFAGIGVKLVGDSSSLDFEMGYRVRPTQKLDINYVTRHIGKDTDSAMNAWGILEENARKLFRGTIDFPSGCAGSKGQEKEEILLLGDGQVNQTVPLILCTEEDVEGDHGATIGRLDEQVLFYLGSRGVGREAAEELISRARLDAVCHRIPDPEVQERTDAYILSMSKGEVIEDEEL